MIAFLTSSATPYCTCCTCELGYETAKGLFARRVMTAGTLVNAKTIRFEPTAVISEQDIKDVISRMDEALADTKKALNV